MPYEIDCSGHFIGSMVPLQGLEQVRLERLRAQADPVHSRRGENLDLRLVQCSGVRFDGPFASWRQVKPISNDGHQAAQLRRVETGGSSSADENRVNRLRLTEGQLQLALEGGEITVG